MIVRRKSKRRLKAEQRFKEAGDRVYCRPRRTAWVVLRSASWANALLAYYTSASMTLGLLPGSMTVAAGRPSLLGIVWATMQPVQLESGTIIFPRDLQHRGCRDRRFALLVRTTDCLGIPRRHQHRMNIIALTDTRLAALHRQVLERNRPPHQDRHQRPRRWGRDPRQ